VTLLTAENTLFTFTIKLFADESFAHQTRTRITASKFWFLRTMMKEITRNARLENY
jgi:hypothetical protein